MRSVIRSVAPDNEIYSVHLEVETAHGHWETFPATGFSRDIGTTFRFRVTSGRVRISDVVLWYQVRVRPDRRRLPDLRQSGVPELTTSHHRPGACPAATTAMSPELAETRREGGHSTSP